MPRFTRTSSPWSGRVGRLWRVPEAVPSRYGFPACLRTGVPPARARRSSAHQFKVDVTRIRDDARQQMDAGSGDLDVRRRSSRSSTRSSPPRWCAGCLQPAQHGLRAAERISQLGGDPDFDPAIVKKGSHTDYVTTTDTDLEKMLRENLVAERIVIFHRSGRSSADRGERSPTTRRLWNPSSRRRRSTPTISRTCLASEVGAR